MKFMKKFAKKATSSYLFEAVMVSVVATTAVITVMACIEGISAV